MRKFIASLFAAFTLVISGLSASPALAHDELLSSYPEANSTVEASTFAVSVTFNEEAMQIDGNEGFGFVITAPDGSDVASSCLSVSGAEVSALISIDQPGDYKVDWRAVSNDGHANSGSFGFTLANTTNFVAESDIQAACDASRSAMGSPSAMPLIMPAPVSAVDDSTESSNSGSFTWIGLGIGAALIVAGSVAGAIRMRMKERKAAENPEILSDDK